MYTLCYSIQPRVRNFHASVVFVKDIMLQHEERIIHHAHISQQEFYGIASETIPAALQVAINRQLGNAQHTTRQIQQDLPDAPTLRTLVPEIPQHLRCKLHQRYQQLNIAQRIYRIDVAPFRSRVQRR